MTIKLFSYCPFCHAPAKWEIGDIRHYECGTVGSRKSRQYYRRCP